MVCFPRPRPAPLSPLTLNMPNALTCILLVHALSLVHTHEYRLEEHDELQVVDRLARLERDDVELLAADVRDDELGVEELLHHEEDAVGLVALRHLVAHVVGGRDLAHELLVDEALLEGADERGRAARDRDAHAREPRATLAPGHRLDHAPLVRRLGRRLGPLAPGGLGHRAPLVEAPPLGGVAEGVEQPGQPPPPPPEGEPRVEREPLRPVDDAQHRALTS
mmetsp:Transcript_28000/g.71095  ORF Transcript_28000/g.71095 Transcript_28000/m.71095 type:complete len:222 (-) Transcript_28000:1179-1844(-)